jgi:hypothetical protein
VIGQLQCDCFDCHFHSPLLIKNLRCFKRRQPLMFAVIVSIHCAGFC